MIPTMIALAVVFGLVTLVLGRSRRGGGVNDLWSLGTLWGLAETAGATGTIAAARLMRAASFAFLAIWLAFLALLFVVAFTLPRPAVGHEAVMPDGSSVDYTNLRNPITGRLCCNKRDCKPVPWKEADGGLVLYELVPGSGEFRRPPANTEMQPIDGNAHVCSNTSQILCVVMPGMGS